MPIYNYKCGACNKIQETYKSIVDRHNSPTCCGAQTSLCILPAIVHPDLPGYQSPVTGEWIEGKKARLEDLKKHRCIPYDPGMKQDAARERARIEAREFDKVKESAARAFFSMAPDKQRILRGAY